MAAVAALVALPGCGGGGKSTPAQPLAGEYQVFATFNTSHPVPVCDQLGGVKTGDPVAVRDAGDKVLARGQLGAPETSTRPADQRNLTTQLVCIWRFTTAPVPKSKQYTVQVANQPPKTYLREDLVAKHWSIMIEEERNLTDQ